MPGSSWNIKKLKTDAMYPASVPRLLTILLRKLPGEVREKVKESPRASSSPRLFSHDAFFWNLIIGELLRVDDPFKHFAYV
jgi:hypothetical protein